MKKIGLICSLFFCSTLSATNLELDPGVNANVLNNDNVSDVKQVILIEGDNQLVLDYTGRLKKQGKREHLSTVPYIVMFDNKTFEKVAVSLVSKNVSVIEKKIDDGQPIFVIEADGKEIISTQLILPPKEGAFPYSDLLALTDTYNKEQGLVFDNGTIRDLKMELQQVNSAEKLAELESENTLQLKLWYNRATEEERKAFQKWVIDHK